FPCRKKLRRNKSGSRSAGPWRQSRKEPAWRPVSRPLAFGPRADRRRRVPKGKSQLLSRLAGGPGDLLLVENGHVHVALQRSLFRRGVEGHAVAGDLEI